MLAILARILDCDIAEVGLSIQADFVPAVIEIRYRVVAIALPEPERIPRKPAPPGQNIVALAAY